MDFYAVCTENITYQNLMFSVVLHCFRRQISANIFCTLQKETCRNFSDSVVDNVPWSREFSIPMVDWSVTSVVYIGIWKIPTWLFLQCRFLALSKDSRDFFLPFLLVNCREYLPWQEWRGWGQKQIAWASCINYYSTSVCVCQYCAIHLSRLGQYLNKPIGR